MYRFLLILFTCSTLFMNELPLGFVETMLVILLVFLPYNVLAHEKQKVRRRVYAGKKHMTVIE